MPLQLGQSPSEEEKRRQGLQGFASQGPNGAPGQDAGLDFQGLFPSVERKPIAGPPPVRDTSGLQFNPEFAARNVGLQRQEADLQRYLNTGRQSADQIYERSVGSANEAQKAARRKLMERMSNQGILQSGIHGQQQGELGTAHQKYLDDLGYLRASNLAGVETDYATRMNQIAGAREGLYGEQTQAQIQAQLEADRQEAERVAREQQAAQQAELVRVQQEQAAAAQAQQAAILQAIQSRQYQAPQVSGGNYAQPQAQGPNWGAQAADFDDIVNWANTMRSNYAGNRGGFNADITRALQSDPNWSGSMQNSMGTYYGGANSIQDVLNWLWFPQAPRLDRGISNQQSQSYANMGVM